MTDWVARLDDFLRMTGNEILQHAGTISHEQALFFQPVLILLALWPAGAIRHMSKKSSTNLSRNPSTLSPV
ncbi:hypothetical protein [Sphingobacterium sp. SGR-19]|uniref:hypothetical protein n=1 Tax=Sphingobacterium sp. SGR-19 TaxID=2710886 RepID=UPI0019D0938B|nr:hypothetical protein [Sphingobacterium sp. SGR-19]